MCCTSHMLTRRVKKYFTRFLNISHYLDSSNILHLLEGDQTNPTVSYFHCLTKLCCKSYLAKYYFTLFHL